MLDNNVPALRFPEFTDTWKHDSLVSITEKIGDGLHGTPTYSNSTGIHFVNGNNLVDGRIAINDSTKQVSYGEYTKNDKGLNDKTLLISINGTIGNIARYRNEKVMLGKSVGYFVFKNNRDFYFHLLNSDKIQKYFISELTGSTIKNLSLRTLRETVVFTPSLPEQQKIASFLTAVDAKIELLTKRKTLLEQYKKGLVQQLFSQQIRFKDGEGNDFPEWEEKQFEEVFERITRKNKENNTNVLTISGQYGLISQIEFFNKSVAAQDLTGYYLLEKGDFAYNKSYSNGYPMGAIKRLTAYPKGVVSTLYICFQIKTGYSADFYDQYSNSGFINHEIQKIAQEGARNHGLLNVSVVEFFRDITLACPSKEEQDKISHFLYSIDQKVSSAIQQLDLAKTHKKGLLQQLFC